MGKKTEARRIAAAAEAARADRLELDAAEASGKRAALRDMVDWVQAEYMKDDVLIHSPKGEALREIAGALTERFRDEG